MIEFNDESLLDKALEFLKNFETFTIGHDIPEAIRNKSNYLAALGLVTYTEVLGGYCRGNLAIRNSQKNFCYFVEEYFPPSYSAINKLLLNDRLNGIYGAIRSGLIHEYFIKTNSKIVMENNYNIDYGIIYRPHEKPQIIFIVEKYFEDFKDAFNKYIIKLKEDIQLQYNFHAALDSIEQKYFTTYSDDISNVSGKGFSFKNFL